MHKYLEKESEISFDKIFNQILGKFFLIRKKKLNDSLIIITSSSKSWYCKHRYIGCNASNHRTNNNLFSYFPSTGYLLFKDFCENTSEEPVPHLKFYEEVSIRVTYIYLEFVWQFRLFLLFNLGSKYSHIYMYILYELCIIPYVQYSYNVYIIDWYRYYLSV